MRQKIGATGFRAANFLARNPLGSAIDLNAFGFQHALYRRA